MALAFASTVAPTTQSPHQITAGVVAIAVASATSAALLDPEQLFQALQLILLLSHVYPCCWIIIEEGNGWLLCAQVRVVRRTGGEVGIGVICSGWRMWHFCSGDSRRCKRGERGGHFCRLLGWMSCGIGRLWGCCWWFGHIVFESAICWLRRVLLVMHRDGCCFFVLGSPGQFKRVKFNLNERKMVNHKYF